MLFTWILLVLQFCLYFYLFVLVYNNISSISIRHLYTVLHIFKKHNKNYINQPWGPSESFYFLKGSTYYSVWQTLGIADFNCILSMITLIRFFTSNAFGLPMQVDKLSILHWILALRKLHHKLSKLHCKSHVHFTYHSLSSSRLSINTCRHCTRT